MKLNYILAFFTSFFVANTSLAQCIPGAVTESIWGTPDDFIFGFTADSNLTDVDTLQVVQGVDTAVVLQYLLPKKQFVSQTGVTGDATVNSLQIIGVTGNPTGLNWTLDSAANGNNNTYNPQSYRYGSVTVCGTTFATPGVKTLTVSAIGCGSLFGISECQGQTFPLYIEVLPAQGGNSSFEFTPPLGCNNMDVDFEATFVSPDPVIFPVEAFYWNLGDGTTTTGTTITAHNYSTPGVYPVKLDIALSEFYISSVRVIATGGWWVDIEEASSLQNPELYGTVNGITIPEQPSGRDVTWSTDIVLSSSNIGGQIFDADNGGFFGSDDDDLGTGSTTITPSDGGSFAINTANYSMTGVINKRISDTISVWDTIFVYPPSVAMVNSSNGTSFCGDDSTFLTVGSGYDAVQWYEDTTVLVGETNDSLKVNTAGNYYAVVLASGSICEGYSDTITISVDGIVMPVIVSTANGIGIDNPNGYDVQWFSNGVPIPGATLDELDDLSSGNPFSVTVTNLSGCSSESMAFDGCIGGYADAPNGTAVDGAVATTFEAIGFSYNSQTEIAWAVTPVADGMISTAADVAAINNENIYLGNGDEIDLMLNCNALQGAGDYYLTPFLIEAVDLPQFPFPYTDTMCIPQMDLAISFVCDNPQTNWSIANVNVIDPAGNAIDILALSPIPINYPLGPQLICGALNGNLPSISLFDLSPNSNPNGTWTIEISNSDYDTTEVMNISVPAFEVSLLAADCGDITADMVYTFGPYNVSVQPGETEVITIKVPPLPTDFPTIASSCSAFGTPVEIQVTNCISSIEDIVNTENIKLYPNPNNGRFTLDFDVLERNDVKISVMDITGRIISVENYDSVEGKFNESFDLRNNLKAGFYLMNIEIGEYNTQQKFIVN